MRRTEFEVTAIQRRLDAHCALSGDCLIWTACLNGAGYGNMSIAGRMYTTHRLSWLVCHGAIPDGMCVLHRCDNRACFRPEHLFLGTVRDNNNDMMAKGRHIPPRGERHGRSRLTEDNVRDILARGKAGEDIDDLAREYRVSRSAVVRVVYRRSWKYIDATGVVR